MPYLLEAVADAGYVLYRPNFIAGDQTEVARRQLEIFDYAQARNIYHLLLDYREAVIPPDLPHYDALVENRRRLAPGVWRLAFLISDHHPSYSHDLFQGFADMLQAMGQAAAVFVDQDAALAWLDAR